MKTNRTTIIASIFLFLFVGIGVWLVFQYVSAEKQRDLQNWEPRLGVIAESQKHSVESWLQKQTAQMQSLAANPLVQIYVTEIDQFQSSNVSESRLGQLHHLRNLLNAVARMAGVFTPVKPISNNRAQTVNDGLAIMNKAGLLLSTRYFPVSSREVNALAKRAVKDKKTLISAIYSDQTNQPRFIIAVPVRSVQSIKAGDYRGVVVAVINPSMSLYKILTRHWLTTNSDESILVVKNRTNILYVSPLSGRYKIFHQCPVGELNVAAAFGAANIGGFAVEKDYKNNRVLVTSRKINNTDWVLIQKINADEALREAMSHQRFILTILLLAVFVVAVSFIAIWRHATSVRLQKTTDQLTTKTALLNAVSESSKDYIFLLDNRQKLVMVNHSLATFLKLNFEDVKGKALNYLYDVDTTRQLLDIKQDEVRNREMRLEINARRYDFHVTVVALKHETYKQSHLYVLHDITELKNAQGRHHRMMEAILQTLVRLTDIHDPHCARHSERTQEVAMAIAQAMDLPADRTQSLAMAALLANVGKLYVSTEILTSAEPLTEAETLLLRKHNQYSVEILEGLEFEGPVIDIVKQKNEYIDGSGYPEGATGDAICLESRILAVANAFVAISSSRAYRSGKPLTDVLEMLFEQADKHYDRRVIAALLFVAENRADWHHWQAVNQHAAD